MKRYLIGILVLFILFQPLITKALVNNNISCPLGTFSKELLDVNHQKGPIHLMDSIVLDAEDEDEFSEFENFDSNEAPVLEYTSIMHNACNVAHFNFTGKAANNAYSNKPLYILWSVFRI